MGMDTAPLTGAAVNVPSLTAVLGPVGGEAAFIGAVLDASPDCIKYVELDGSLSLMNANGMCAMEIDDFDVVKGRHWADLWPEESAGLVRDAVGEAAAGRSSRFEAFCPTAKGQPRWWDISVAPVFGAEREAIGIVSISRDISRTIADRRALDEAKEQAEIALREVNHRVKNLFSLVPAIVQLSARAADDIPSLASGISNRVAALARSHTLTLNAFSQEKGASLDALIHAVLEPFAERADAFTLIGPTLRLASREANAMSLALHELATNAVKYGALAERNGRVSISWKVETSDADGSETGTRRLVFRWCEAGGPAITAPPTRSGFGTQLIDRLIRLQEGVIERDWKKSGLDVTIALPLRASD